MEQEEQEIIRSDMAYGMNRETVLDQGQVRFILDSSDILLQMKCDLMRMEINKNKEIVPIKHLIKYVKKDKDGNDKIVEVEEYLEPLINQSGFSDIKAIISPYLSKNNYLAEKDKFEIASQGKLFMVEFLGMIYQNHEKFNLNIKSADMVTNICFNYMIDAAKRSEGGVTNTMLTTISKVFEHKMPSKNEEQQQKGGFGSWMRNRR